MNNDVYRIMKDMTFSEPAEETAIKKAEQNLGVSLPEQYKEFLRKTNGAEGPIGETNYLALWALELVEEINKGSDTRSFLPGLLLFGSDGGDETYAFDSNRDFVILDVPFAAFDIEETEVIAETFEEFINRQNI